MKIKSFEMKAFFLMCWNKIRANRIFSILFLVIILSEPANSQDKKWTLTECINRALQENTTVNQRKLANNVSELTLEQSKATRIPTLSGSSSQGFTFGRSLDPYTNTYVPQDVKSSNFSLNSSLNLFTGFQTINTIKKNELDLKAGTLDLEKTKKDVNLNVNLAYLQVLFAYEQVENAKVQVESTQSQVEKTQILVNAGTLPIGSLYTVQSQLATDKYNLVNAENQLSISKVNLMQLMEFPVDPYFDIVRPDLTKMVIEPTSVLFPDSIYSKALQVQPEIESAELKVTSAETNLKISKASLYPRLSLSAGVSSAYSDARTRTFDEQLRDNLSQSVRLSLSIPIFNQKQVSTSIQKSEISVLTTQLTAQDTRNQLRKSIEQAYNDKLAAQNNYGAVQNQLISTETSYNDSKRKYELGMITATDYLIAKNNYSTAVSNLIRAKYNYLFMNKILDFYQGNSIEF
jgi:outer membrane protein